MTCEHKNPPGSKFCAECGEQLENKRIEFKNKSYVLKFDLCELIEEAKIDTVVQADDPDHKLEQDDITKLFK